MIAALLVAFSLGLPIASDPGESPAERAARAYRDGRYDEAAALFETCLRDPELPRGALFFDLGNCAFRSGRMPEALLWWHRARLRTPRSPELAFSIARAERELGLQPTPLGWSAHVTPGEVLVLVVGLQSLGLVGLVLARRRTTRLLCIAMLAASVPACWELARGSVAGRPDHGIVLGSRVAVRSEPHREFAGTGELPPGALVRIVATSDRWTRVESALARGWVERGALGFVE